MPAAARKGDWCIPHCSPYTTSRGSNNVFINGKPANRVGDSVQIHLFKVGNYCIPHAPPIKSGAETVFINGRPAAFVGSKTCTAIATGSRDVFISGAKKKPPQPPIVVSP
jgi:uncharacterized Zn-binding protein involved in type VI secretion